MPLTLPASRHLRRQGRVLHHPRHQGLVPEEVLLRRRPGADRPVGRLGRRGRPERREADPRRGRAVRDLPRGHPLPRRQALPRQDRRRPARARDRRPRHPGRRARHRRRGPARQEVRHASPGPACGSASRSTSPATRAWRTTATSCARSPTRSCTRSCGSPARSTSTPTPARAKEESKRLEKAAKEAKEARDGGGRARRVRRRAAEGVLNRVRLWSRPGARGRGPAVPGAGHPAGRRPPQRGRAQRLPRRQLPTTPPPAWSRWRSWSPGRRRRSGCTPTRRGVPRALLVGRPGGRRRPDPGLAAGQGGGAARHASPASG